MGYNSKIELKNWHPINKIANHSIPAAPWSLSGCDLANARAKRDEARKLLTNDIDPGIDKQVPNIFFNM